MKFDASKPAEVDKALKSETDAKWVEIREHLNHLMSEEGPSSNNPLKNYFSDVRRQVRENYLSKMSEDGFKESDLDEETSEAKERRAELSKLMKDEVDNVRSQVMRNAYLGYKQKTPIEVSSILEGGASGALEGMWSLSPIQGAIVGIKNSIKDFVLGLPGVGKFMRTVNNYIGGKFDKWFNNGEDMTWSEASVLAEAQAKAASVEQGLRGMSGLDAEALAVQLSQKLKLEGASSTTPETEVAETDKSDKKADDKTKGEEADKTQASADKAPDELKLKTKPADENKDKPAAEDKNDDHRTTGTDALDEFRSVVMNGSGKPVGESDMPSHGLAFAEGSSVKGSFVG